MSTYTTIARSLQSKLSKRAFAIRLEESLKQFYKECGRTKEARSSKLRLKELHAEQSIEKHTLKIVQQLCYEESWHNQIDTLELS